MTKNYRSFSKLLGFVYVALAILFFFFPEQFLYLMNIGPKAFGLGQPVAAPADHFWIIMAAGAVTMEAALSFMAAAHPEVMGYTAIHLLSKGLSVFGFIYCFFIDRPLFAYLVSALFDGCIGIWLLWTFIQFRGQLKATK